MRKRACEAILARHRVLTCIRPQLRPPSCRGPEWCSKIGSRSKPRARRHSVAPWFFRSHLTTIAPSCSLPSYAPTSSRLTDGLRRRSRSLVDATPGHQSPDDPRHLVRQRDPHQHRRLARQHPAQPGSRPGRGMDMAFDDDAVGANDQEASQRPFAHPRRGSEAPVRYGTIKARTPAWALPLLKAW